MSSSTNANHRFLSWVRQGLAAGITTKDNQQSGTSARVALSVAVKLKGRNDAGSFEETVQQSVKLYGPGDVIGLDPRQVLRTEPKHRTTDFEPNFFPSIEFDRPDLPWLFTPAAASDNLQLRPWLCLVAVRKQPGVTLRAKADRPLPVLRIESPANPVAELPDLHDSWAWAHAQAAGTFSTESQLATLLEESPELSVSRLVCPRKLESKASYYACVVPAFEVGRAAGLGLSTSITKTTPAWTSATVAPFELPVYYHWEFATGEAGSFESLVRRLTPRKLPEVGMRETDVTAPGHGIEPSAQPVVLQMEGALVSNDAAPGAWPESHRDAFQTELRELLNRPAVTATDLVTPPIYGSVHAGQTTVPDADAPPLWLRELNLDPRQRAAAGLGTRVVQQNQEALMASAWAQSGDVKGVNRALRLGQLAREIGGFLLRRHFDTQSTGTLLQLTQAIHSQLFLRTTLADNPPTNASVLPVFRRLARRRGPLGRRLFGQSKANSGTLIENIRSGQISLSAVRPREAPPPATADLNTVSDTLALTYEPVRYTNLRTLKLDKSAGWTKTAWPKPPTVTKSAPAPAAPLDEYLPGMIANFRTAVQGHQKYLNAGAALVGKAAVKEFVSLAEKWQTIRTDLIGRLDPGKVFLKRLKKRVSVRGRIWERNPFWDRPEPLDPVALAPSFPTPMYKPLAELSQELFVPGLGSVPPDTLGVLVPNRRFVEAYMVGLNHEMSREFLWRDYPVERDATYFQHFWSKSAADIPPVKEWDKNRRLGENFAGQTLDNFVVLVLRGELLRRYPSTAIYAARAALSDTTPKTRTLATPEEVRHPIFRGRLDPDITFLGFDLMVKEARGSTTSKTNPGWFFVFQEQPVEPRFGLDVPVGFPAPLPSSPADVSWSHVASSAEALAALTHARPTGTPLDGKSIGGIKWGQNAAQMAALTYRPTARVAVHADSMLSARKVVVTVVERDASNAVVAVGGTNRDGTRWRLTKQRYDELKNQERAEFEFSPPSLAF